MKCKRRGFTLLEAMITVTVIAILGAIALTAYNGYVGRGAVSNAKMALEAGRLAMENWRAKQGTYETDGKTIEELPGYSAEVWSGVEARLRYKVVIDEGATTKDGFKLRATCDPDGDPQCKLARGASKDVWTINQLGKLEHELDGIP